jgi:tryptophan-rich sensory protein
MLTTRDILGALAWLGLTFAAAFIGSRFLPDAWYAGLRKPSWNPPSWLFAPVWTLLYLMMAAAAWIVWRRHSLQGALVPLILFVLQLVLNCIWTWLFFGRHRLGAALVDIGALWVVLLATLIAFWGLQPLAGQLMVPYLVWVTFATFLNLTIYRLNPSAQPLG